jgi:uncharacterized membrane protein YciS (DUF1049 family)
MRRAEPAGAAKACYRELDPARIIETAERLARRVSERFPEAGLARVAAEFVTLSRDLARAAERLAEPIWPARLLVGLAILAGIGVLFFAGTIVSFNRITPDAAFDFVQGVEALMNAGLLVGLGLLALVSLEERIKRKRAFRALHGLRSLIHVVDMHQLTKDPSVLSADFKPTAESPVRITDASDLSRYLDYCSEMLSLTGKIAALFAQSVNDAVVIEAVNDIENLGSNLSRKIWQKITIIEEFERRRG